MAASRLMLGPSTAEGGRQCERSEAIQGDQNRTGLLRRLCLLAMTKKGGAGATRRRHRKKSLPLAQIEARQLVRIRRELEVLAEGVRGRVGEHRQPVGLLGDALDRLGIG